MTAPEFPVTIVVPAYNEERGVARTAERLAVALAAMPAGSEAIFVEDGSRDGTAQALAQACADRAAIRIVAHDRNRGYGAALKTGIKAARNEWIAIADADGTYPLESIPAFAAEAQSRDAMVVGARRGADQAMLRRFAKSFLAALASHLAGCRIPDINSGLRVFRREHAVRHRRLLPDGFSFTTTITMALLTEGESVVFQPIEYRPRVGRSKIRPVRDTANFALLILRTALAFNPLRVFGPASVAMLLAGSALLVARMLSAHTAGLATTVVLLVGGLVVLAIGLLADLVNRRGG